jgi:hypothetical protein
VYLYKQSSFSEFASSALPPLENHGYDDMSSDFSTDIAVTGTTAGTTATSTTTMSTAAGTGTTSNSAALMRLDSLDWLRSAKQAGMASPRDADVSADVSADAASDSAAAAAAAEDSSDGGDAAAAGGVQRPAKRAKVESELKLEIDTSMVSHS